jgi:anaerobic sulfite reductase subunit B
MPYLPKKYKIEKIQEHAPNIKLFKIKSPLNPQPGQFLELSIPGFGECPLASCFYDKKYLYLLVKKTGNVTSALFNLKKGKEVFIRGPYGKGWPLRKLKNKNIIAIAGGTGIAPVTSLISYIKQNKKYFQSVKIYFGFRNEKYILLKNIIDKWKKIFDITICLDKKLKKTKSFEQGFVHQVIEKRQKSFSKNSFAILCGPEIMMKSVTDVLNKNKIKNNNIYWSLERRMECGFGNCGRCLIQDLYVCKDGPVFQYSKIKPKLDNENSANDIKNGK